MSDTPDQVAAEPPVVTALWLQHEVYELLSNRWGVGASKPAFMVGLRGSDLVVFAPGGEQYVILFEVAR